MGLPRPTFASAFATSNCVKLLSLSTSNLTLPSAVQHELAVDQNIHVGVLLFHLKLSFPFDDEVQAPEDVK